MLEVAEEVAKLTVDFEQSIELTLVLEAAPQCKFVLAGEFLVVGATVARLSKLSLEQLLAKVAIS